MQGQARKRTEGQSHKIAACRVAKGRACSCERRASTMRRYPALRATGLPSRVRLTRLGQEASACVLAASARRLFWMCSTCRLGTCPRGRRCRKPLSSRRSSRSATRPLKHSWSSCLMRLPSSTCALCPLLGRQSCTCVLHGQCATELHVSGSQSTTCWLSSPSKSPDN
jgi:hypothetical protein